MARGWLRETLRQRLIATRPGAYWRYYVWKRGLQEPELSLLPALCRKHDVAVDVGANLGLYTNIFSQLELTVHAFEPIPRLAGQLRSGYQKLSNIHIHECGLSDTAGSATLKIPVERRRYGYATIEASNDLTTKAELSGQLQTLQIDIKTLDDFDFPSVDIVKIDVEGHEFAVLEGAETTIDRFHPIFIIEVEERHNTGSVLRVQRFLAERGYQAFFMRSGKLHTFEHFHLERDQDETHPERYVRNFVFLRPNHLERVTSFLADSTVDEGYSSAQTKTAAMNIRELASKSQKFAYQIYKKHVLPNTFVQGLMKNRLQKEVSAFKPYTIRKDLDGVSFDFQVGDSRGKRWYDIDEVGCNIEMRFIRDTLVEPGDVIFECGSHHGYTTLLLSNWAGDAGQVHAFEASNHNHEILKHNIELNNVANTTCYHRAVGSTHKTVQMSFDYNTVVLSGESGLSTEMVPLDAFKDKQPTLLKLDVEGFETEVLKGCSEILKTRPKLAIELHTEQLPEYGTSVQEIFDLVGIDNYNVWIQWTEDAQPVPYNNEPISKRVHIFARPRG